MIDLSRTTPEDATKMRAKIDAGEVTALYVHLAEGLDDRSRKEFTELKEAKLLTPATVIIHGTALTEDQLGEVKDAGAKLVWSPQSNLRLYGETTSAARAVEMGITVGLGADWLPSGSQSLLAELAVARRELERQKVDLSPAQLNKKLLEAVTTDAAKVAGLEEARRDREGSRRRPRRPRASPGGPVGERPHRRACLGSARDDRR